MFCVIRSNFSGYAAYKNSELLNIVGDAKCEELIRHNDWKLNETPKIAMEMTILGVFFITEMGGRFTYRYFILVFFAILFALLKSC
jgi:hypothetical protein